MNTPNVFAGRLERRVMLVDDLSMLVKRLVHELKKHDENNLVAKKAMDYLREYDCDGQALR
jgi:hypothetical protein